MPDNFEASMVFTTLCSQPSPTFSPKLTDSIPELEDWPTLALGLVSSFPRAVALDLRIKITITYVDLLAV